MTILEITTGLFPDAQTVTQAVTALGADHALSRKDASGIAADDAAAWQDLADAVLAADRVITI